MIKWLYLCLRVPACFGGFNREPFFVSFLFVFFYVSYFFFGGGGLRGTKNAQMGMPGSEGDPSHFGQQLNAKQGVWIPWLFEWLASAKAPVLA